MDNTKSFWEAHKAIYLESVKAPMTALTDALGPEFGTPKVFRPFRDVRFAKEKSTVNACSATFLREVTPANQRQIALRPQPSATT